MKLSKITLLFHTFFSSALYLFCLQRQIAALQKTHNEAREANRKLTSTVDTLMASHSELQKAVEGLQTELGMRDSELGALRREKYGYIL